MIEPTGKAPVTAPDAASRPAPTQSLESLSRLPADGPLVGRLLSQPGTPEGSAGYRQLLQVAGRSYEVLTPRPIAQDTQVRVVRDAQGQISLHLPPPAEETLTQALRRQLPLQQPPDRLLDQLALRVQQLQASGGQLRLPALLGLFQGLLAQALRHPERPQPERLRQQIARSGTFFERSLAQGDSETPLRDQKALMLKLSHQLESEPPGKARSQLQQSLEQGLARVVSNQVASLQGRGGFQQPPAESNGILLDLPVRTADGGHENIALRIGREDDSSEDAEAENSRWTVRLAFQQAGLPDLSAVLTLEGDRVGVLWSGDEELRSWLGPQLAELRRRLEARGLEPGVIGVRREEGNASATDGSALIDVHS